MLIFFKANLNLFEKSKSSALFVFVYVNKILYRSFGVLLWFFSSSRIALHYSETSFVMYSDSPNSGSGAKGFS
jgi:hypothetical protein